MLFQLEIYHIKLILIPVISLIVQSYYFSFSNTFNSLYNVSIKTIFLIWILNLQNFLWISVKHQARPAMHFTVVLCFFWSRYWIGEIKFHAFKCNALAWNCFLLVIWFSKRCRCFGRNNLFVLHELAYSARQGQGVNT